MTLTPSQLAALRDLSRTGSSHSVRTIAANARTNHGANVTAGTLHALYRLGYTHVDRSQTFWRITKAGRAALEASTPGAIA